MTRSATVLALLMMARCDSCGGPSSWGLRCAPDLDCLAVREGAADAVRRWPEVAPIVNRLDVDSAPPDSIARVCRRPDLRRVESCAVQPGSGLARARIVVVTGAGAETPALVEHEIQHLRPSVWALPDACADHRPACWEE